MTQVESWEKKFVSQFTNDPNHGNIPCETCHGSDISADSSGIYHSRSLADGTFIADPANDPSVSCGGAECHGTMPEIFEHSLHFALYGERTEVSKREGVSSFDLCPTAVQDGHTKECRSCHASCGDCHISRPNTVHAGLVEGHLFYRTPSRTENCQACHGSRIAIDFEGHIITDSLTNMIYNNEPNYANLPDVHLAAAEARGYSNACLMCHDGDEMHYGIPESERNSVTRYDYTEAASCDDCHDMGSLPNMYHNVHGKGTSGTELQCQVCHSQPYDNCNACHVVAAWEPVKAIEPWTTEGGEYQLNNPYYGFRIAKNPIRYTNSRTEDYSIVRHIPVARDSYANWGYGSITGYDLSPTWKYATPHNIIRNTPQTAAQDGLCYASCHADGVKNSQLYLTTDFLQTNYPDEINANAHIVMDGKFSGVLK